MVGTNLQEEMSRRDQRGDYFQGWSQKFSGPIPDTAGGGSDLRKTILNYKYKVKYGILEGPIQVRNPVV